MKRIVVLGGGFGGLWSAIGAARKLHEQGVGSDQIKITLIEKNDFHSIRVRNYEEDLAPSLIPLSKVLDPIGVEHLQGEVLGIDLAVQTVRVKTAAGEEQVKYDRLVYALGSRLKHAPIAGIREHGFDINEYAAARKLQDHLKALAGEPGRVGRNTVLVIGSGLVGIELATDLSGRLDRILGTRPGEAHVILADARNIGSDMGEQACEVINEALDSLHIEKRPNVMVKSVDAEGAVLASGERIAAATVVWCGGMQAHELTAAFPGEKDRFGRISVDEHLRVKGVQNVYAAGDVASADTYEGRTTVMSCQQGIPMGRFAGHNVAADLLGEPLLPMHLQWYDTCLDLGPWGAVYTEGWERAVARTGEDAKSLKRTINQQRIYPPLSEDAKELYEAAKPTIRVRVKDLQPVS